MSTVPRPAQPTEADTLRALLDAVADLLDVPITAGASIADRHRTVSGRAIIAKVAIRATSTYMDPAIAVTWMREELAKLEGGAL